ncbi:MAG TPA: SAM-dependent methyltransferase [Chthoniobacterales bacterium]|nr:SAM-dependent methyltransferase [Chthoniobacterales bacterium]
MTDPVEQLVTAIRDSIDDQTFLKLTLGKFQNDLPPTPSYGATGPATPGLRRDGAAVQHVYVRVVDLKTGPHLSFVYRYPNQDITKNSPIPEGIEIITGWLGSACRSATLLTSKGRQQLLFGRRGQPRLFSQDSPSTPETSRAHDREKVRLLREERALELLGVIDAEGRPRAQMGNKYRQVHHFIEALEPISRGASPGETLHIVDMGCGKGYLTFALHQFLRENGENPVTIGVEKRSSLVESANAIADQLGDNSIRFIQGEINDVDVKPIDILIALHACDTATDDAIYRGIQEKCRWIVVSPCCQHELGPQLTAPAGLEPMFRHGVQVDRMTETVTDTLRCLYLEAWGYQTRIQEFVGTEHTAKNLLIVASRTRKPGPSQDLMERALEFQHRFGIQNQRLGNLLSEAGSLGHYGHPAQAADASQHEQSL